MSAIRPTRIKAAQAAVKVRLLLLRPELLDPLLEALAALQGITQAIVRNGVLVCSPLISLQSLSSYGFNQLLFSSSYLM